MTARSLYETIARHSPLRLPPWPRLSLAAQKRYEAMARELRGEMAVGNSVREWMRRRRGLSLVPR